MDKDRVLDLVLLLAMCGLLFELWHNSSDVALGGLVGLAMRALDLRTTRRQP